MCHDSQDRFERVREVLDAGTRDSIMQLPQVVGVGIGEVQVVDRNVPCIKVFLAGNVPRDQLQSFQEQLQALSAGVPVDVVESGPFKAL